MARKKQRPQESQETQTIEAPVAEVPIEPRRFMPRDCTLCVTRRKPGESYVRVYSKHGSIRYCRCGMCGNTWSQEG